MAWRCPPYRAIPVAPMFVELQGARPHFASCCVFLFKKRQRRCVLIVAPDLLMCCVFGLCFVLCCFVNLLVLCSMCLICVLTMCCVCCQGQTGGQNNNIGMLLRFCGVDQCPYSSCLVVCACVCVCLVVCIVIRAIIDISVIITVVIGMSSVIVIVRVLMFIHISLSIIISDLVLRLGAVWSRGQRRAAERRVVLGGGGAVRDGRVPDVPGPPASTT